MAPLSSFTLSCDARAPGPGLTCDDDQISCRLSPVSPNTRDSRDAPPPPPPPCRPFSAASISHKRSLYNIGKFGETLLGEIISTFTSYLFGYIDKSVGISLDLSLICSSGLKIISDDYY